MARAVLTPRLCARVAWLLGHAPQREEADERQQLIELFGTLAHPQPAREKP